MRKPYLSCRWVAAASLLLNLVLATGLLLQTHPAPDLPPPPVSVPPAAASEAGSQAVSSVDGHALSSMIGSGDFSAAISELRRLEFQETIITDIVAGAINRRYAPRVLALRSHAWRYWEPCQRRNREETADEVQNERMARSLESERNHLVREIVGLEWSAIESSVTGRPDPLDRFTEAFPPGSRVQARVILAEYDALEREVIRGAGGTVGRPERAELDRLYQLKLQELARFLTAAELEEYEVRTSPTAERLRQIGLVGFNPTEEEFRAVFRVRKALDEQCGQAGVQTVPNAQVGVRQAHQAFEGQLREALGEARFGEYLRSQDYTFRGLVELADEFDLPVEAAVQVHDLREKVLLRRRELAQAGTVTYEQLSALDELAGQTQEAVRGVLGDAAYQRYAGLDIGSWIDGGGPR